MQPNGEVPLPTVLGLMICEQFIIDKETNNVSLINCFTSKQLGKFPSEPQRIAIAAFLSGYVGQARMDLVIRRLDTLDELMHRSFVLRFLERLTEVRFLARLRLPFPVAGTYEVALEANGEILAQRRLEFS